MRKALQIAVFAVLGCMFSLAQTTTTITGTVRDLTNALVTSGKVTFDLRPSRDTTISGYARFSSQTVTCTITGAGLIKALDGTSVCTVTKTTALQPTGEFYAVCYWPANVKTACFTFYAVNDTYDWSTVVPTPTTSPAQNFVDIFSNQSIGGNKTWLGTQTFAGTNIFSGPVSFAGQPTFGTGMIVDVSGSGCTDSLQLTNIDVAPVNPNKYFRINQTTGALEIIDSTCSTLLFSLSNTGVLIIPTSVTSPLFQAAAGVQSVLQGNGAGAAVLGGRHGIGGGFFQGDDASCIGGTGTGTAASGACVLAGGNGFGLAQRGISVRSRIKFGPISPYDPTVDGIPTINNGVPFEFAGVGLFTQTAAVATTTLYAVPSAGQGYYRISWNAKVTTAAGTSSTLGALTISYTDFDGVVQTITMPASTSAGAIATTNTGNTTTSVLLGLPLTINAKASTNITYAFGYASNAANAMNYELQIVLESI